MNNETVTHLITPLFEMYNKVIKPASEANINKFAIKARKLFLPLDVVNELSNFYKITNGIPCLDGFDFHCCNDEILFEWWENKVIWLGQRDDYIITWYENKYCIGDASNVSFSKEYEFNNLEELLKKVVNDWFNNYL